MISKSSPPDRESLFNGLMLFLCYIAYSSIYISRLNISVASALLEGAGTIAKTQYGIIGGVFCLVYAVGQLLNGYLGDLFPAKLLISAGVLIAGICNLAIGFLPFFWSILIFWGINGYGQSMVWGPMLRSCVSRMKPQRRPLLSSILISSVSFGSILGLLISSRFAGQYGVAACFLVPGAVTLAAGIVFSLCFRGGHEVGQLNQPSPRMPVKTLLAQKSFRRMIAPAMAHGVIKDNITLWLAVYYVDTFGINVTAVSGFIFFVPLLGLVGRLLYPVMFIACGKNENRVSILAFFLCAVASSLLLNPNASVLPSTICLCAISALVQMINTSVLTVYPASFAPTGNVSFVAGTMDFFTYVGAGISSLFFGAIISAFGYGSMFLVWCLLSAVSIIFLTVISRSRSKPAAIRE